MRWPDAAHVSTEGPLGSAPSSEHSSIFVAPSSTAPPTWSRGSGSGNSKNSGVVGPVRRGEHPRTAHAGTADARVVKQRRATTAPRLALCPGARVVVLGCAASTGRVARAWRPRSGLPSSPPMPASSASSASPCLAIPPRFASSRTARLIPTSTSPPPPRLALPRLIPPPASPHSHLRLASSTSASPPPPPCLALPRLIPPPASPHSHSASASPRLASPRLVRLASSRPASPHPASPRLIPPRLASSPASPRVVPPRLTPPRLASSPQRARHPHAAARTERQLRFGGRARQPSPRHGQCRPSRRDGRDADDRLSRGQHRAAWSGGCGLIR
jgi:hypothetical protein